MGLAIRVYNAPFCVKIHALCSYTTHKKFRITYYLYIIFVLLFLF